MPIVDKMKGFCCHFFYLFSYFVALWTLKIIKVIASYHLDMVTKSLCANGLEERILTGVKELCLRFLSQFQLGFYQKY